MLRLQRTLESEGPEEAEDAEDLGGRCPQELIAKWEPWVLECIDYLIDAHGTFRRFKYDLPLNEQPFVDLQIYNLIRAQFIKLSQSKGKQDGSG